MLPCVEVMRRSVDFGRRDAALAPERRGKGVAHVDAGMMLLRTVYGARTAPDIRGTRAASNARCGTKSGDSSLAASDLEHYRAYVTRTRAC